jgi:hypothetical protein
METKFLIEYGFMAVVGVITYLTKRELDRLDAGIKASETKFDMIKEYKIHIERNFQRIENMQKQLDNLDRLIDSLNNLAMTIVKLDGKTEELSIQMKDIADRLHEHVTDH